MKGNMISLGGQQGGELLKTVTAAAETSGSTATDFVTITHTLPSSQFNKYYCLLITIENNIIEGYYYSSKFYSDSSHEHLINGQEKYLYKDLSTQKTYTYSNNTFSSRQTNTSAYYFKNGLNYINCSQPLNILINNLYYKVTKNTTGELHYYNHQTTSGDITALGAYIRSCTFTSSSNNIIITIKAAARSSGTAVHDGYGTHTIKLYGIQLN